MAPYIYLNAIGLAIYAAIVAAQSRRTTGAGNDGRLREMTRIAIYPIAFCAVELFVYFTLVVILDYFWLSVPLSGSLYFGAAYVFGRVSLLQAMTQLILLQLSQYATWRYHLSAALGAAILGLVLSRFAFSPSLDRVVQLFRVDLATHYVGSGVLVTISAVAAWIIVRRWDFVVRNRADLK